MGHLNVIACLFEPEITEVKLQEIMKRMRKGRIIRAKRGLSLANKITSAEYTLGLTSVGTMLSIRKGVLVQDLFSYYTSSSRPCQNLHCKHNGLPGRVTNWTVYIRDGNYIFCPTATVAGGVQIPAIHIFPLILLLASV